MREVCVRECEYQEKTTLVGEMVMNRTNLGMSSLGRTNKVMTL